VITTQRNLVAAEETLGQKLEWNQYIYEPVYIFKPWSSI
jgi:hypothetical protein